MKKKFDPIYLLISIFVIILGGYFTYNVAVYSIYKIGADNIFKPSEACSLYKELFISEMKKNNHGNTSPIIQQAKQNKCTK